MHQTYYLIFVKDGTTIWILAHFTSMLKIHKCMTIHEALVVAQVLEGSKHPKKALFIQKRSGTFKDLRLSLSSPYVHYTYQVHTLDAHCTYSKHIHIHCRYNGSTMYVQLHTHGCLLLYILSLINFALK